MAEAEEGDMPTPLPLLDWWNRSDEADGGPVLLLPLPLPRRKGLGLLVAVVAVPAAWADFSSPASRGACFVGFGVRVLCGRRCK